MGIPKTFMKESNKWKDKINKIILVEELDDFKLKSK